MHGIAVDGLSQHCPNTKHLHLLDKLLTHVAALPEAVAFEHDGHVACTYSSLAGAAAGLAQRLVSVGVGFEDRVALHLPRGPDWVVALLATWIAGGAVLPLDPSLPVARRTELVRRGNPRAIVGEAWPDVPHVRLVGEPATLSEHTVDSNRLAWLIFSSGSTGEPKGVLVEHGNYSAIIADQARALNLATDDREAWLLSPQFDASLSDIGVALWSGVTLCTDSRPLLESLPDLRAFLRSQRITYADLPPRLLEIFEPSELPDLRTVLCGGEPLPPNGARRWAQQRRLIGVYGPTEATICTSLWQVRPDDVEDPLIGEPVGGAVLRIHGEELWIGGPGVARGYSDDPVLTAKRFVVDTDGSRWHRTGDRVKRRADGRLVFAGRIDRQCKVDGRLVCPEEVEQALVELEGVAAAAVVVDEISNVNVLHAYVEPIPGVSLDVAMCEAALTASLPNWMIPRLWSIRDIPRTSSGKPDVSSLRHVGTEERASAADGRQDAVAALVAMILGVDVGELSDTQPFSAMGLDSLRTLQLSAAMAAMGIYVSPQQLRAANSIAGLRAVVPAGSSPSSNADELIAKGKLAARELPLPSSTSRSASEAPILLTGATGGLGSRVLASFLSRSFSVLVLVRAADQQHAESRLADVFRRYELSASLLDKPGLSIVCGDLSQLHSDGTGAVGAMLKNLSWSGIVHLAADLNLTAEARTLWQINVNATAGLLSLSLSRGGVPFWFASTLSVFVDTDVAERSFSEDMPAPCGVNVFGGYAQTKLAAEVLVESARNVPCLVVRYGLLVGSSTAKHAQHSDWLSMVIRGLRRIGAVPETQFSNEFAFDVTPTDEAAEATADLWMRLVAGQNLPNRAHIAAPCPSTLDDLLSACAAEGCAVDTVPISAFHCRVARALSKTPGADEAAAAMLAFGHHLSAELQSCFRATILFRASGVRFGGEQTAAHLGRPAITPTTPERLRRLVRGALQAP